MSKLTAILMILVSIPFLGFGLIFLIATATNPSRFLTAAALLLIGGVLLVLGAFRLRRLFGPTCSQHTPADLRQPFGHNAARCWMP